MRIIYRLMLVGALAVAGMTAYVTPVAAGKPALDCEANGQWYPNGWTGYIDGRWMSCDNGLWHMM